MLVAVQHLNREFLDSFVVKLAHVADCGADAVELRLDLADSKELDLESMISASPLPVIVSARLESDGGKWKGSEEERKALLTQAVDAGASYVDLESDCEWRADFEHKCKLIVSYHDFAETDGTRIRSLIAELKTSGADIIKIVTKAKSLNDNLVYRELLRETQEIPVAGFCMGASGAPSRILALNWGSALSYCAAPGAGELAPGMLSLDAMVRTYHAKLKEERPLYGVVGSAVAHSLSPHIHNGTLVEGDAPALFLPLQTDSFDDAVSFAQSLGVKGLSVTTPFKQEAASKGQADEVGSVGAANTLISDGGGWSAANTDVDGFRRDLESLVDAEKLAASRVLILGSGGAARAVACALSDCAGELLVWARDPKKGKELAASLGLGFHPSPQSDDHGFDLVINTTSAGMTGGPAPNDSPLNLKALILNPGAAVYDLVYSPAMTPFLKDAKSLGLKYRGGLGMLVEQAAGQQRLWSGQSFESREIIKATIRSALAEGSRSRPHNTVLVGYRGAGKTTIGKTLAGKLSLFFVDLDEEIAKFSGDSIQNIFAKGEEEFRQLELNQLGKLAEKNDAKLLAVGGGIVETPECRKLLREHFTVIYLEVPQEILVSRLERDAEKRPALGSGSISEQTVQRLARRTPHYRSIADSVISVSGDESIEEIATRLYERLTEPN